MAGRSDAHDDPLGLESRSVEFARLFADLDATDLDESIKRSLSLFAEIANADCCTLLMHERTPVQQLVRFDWLNPSLGDRYVPFTFDEARSHRWATDQLVRGDCVHIPSVADLPESAQAERSSLQARGIVSSLTLPIRRGEKSLGTLVLECVRSAHWWTAREIAWLNMNSALLLSAVQRIRSELALARQLEVEQRIASLSNRFLGLGPDRTNEGIELSLDLALDVSGADRAYMVAIEPRPPFIPQSFERSRAGVGSFAQRIESGSPETFSWSSKVIADGTILRIEDPNALPPEASEEHRDLVDRGVQSLLGIPVHVEGTLVGYLGLEFLREPHHWTPAEITRCKLIADILAGARRRQRAESELAHQLESEQRIAELSRQFMALPAEQTDAAVVEGLRQAAELVGAQRAQLLHLADSGRPPDRYEWLADGVESVPVQPLRWARERIARGEVLRIDDVSALPEDAAQVREILTARGVRSLLGIPLQVGEQLAGYMGFETMHEKRWWTSEEITLLRLIGELLTGALQRRRTEMALRESQSQLIHSQKMEAVGRLAGGIAHDFNNLLTVILGFSRALMSDLAADDQAREDVQEIHEAAERAAGLTRQLLTFSRRQHAESRAIDLAARIEGLREMLERLLGEDVDLDIEMPEDGFWVEGDPYQLEQVIVNLAVNARDAMPDGGRLLISGRVTEVGPADAQRLGLAGPGPHAAISVEDDGDGVDGEILERIFEPFFTTKEPGKGTGLGLSIVYSVVTEAGGAVTVRGGGGKGTTFEIHLPIHGAGALEDPSDEVDETAEASATVLLAEDQDSVRRLARRILERAGYRVLEARDGVEALEVAGRTEGEIDLLLTDVVMPQLNGDEVAERILADRPDMRVVFVSGHPQGRSEGLAGSPERGRFLYKPFTANSLLGEIQAALES